jgi:hypothetical protein
MTPEERLKRLIDTAQYHAKMATDSGNTYFGVGHTFRVVIPVLSAGLTVIASDKTPIPKELTGDYTFWMGAALTLFTSINAAIQPLQQFYFNAR